MSSTEKKQNEPSLPDPGPDTEQLLLARLENTADRDEYFRWMLFVVGYYRGIKKVDAAVRLLDEFIPSSTDPEQTAHCYLALGQMATDARRHELALEHFRAALDLQPKRRKVLYVLHNNIGYCLNSLGKFSDGETHCRAAIETDWTRASGYRNLGISLSGQKNNRAAAWAFVQAMSADASDKRARVLLQKLLSLHPDLALFCPWAVEALLAEPEGLPRSLIM